jgi:hypothetical protein
MESPLKNQWAIRRAGLSVLASLALLLAVSAFAQTGSDTQFPAIDTIMVLYLLLLAAFYVYLSLALQTIAKKTDTDNSWLAWIPIVNIILMLNIAHKPLWWFILFFIPFVNVVFAIIVWMSIAEARGKPSWWGIMLIVPGLNLIVPGYLAWSD